MITKSQLTPNCRQLHYLMHTAKEHSVSVTEEQEKDPHHNSQARPPFVLHRPVCFCTEFFFLLLFLFVRPCTFSRPNSWRRRPAKGWGQNPADRNGQSPRGRGLLSGRPGRGGKGGGGESVSPPSATQHLKGDAAVHGENYKLAGSCRP